MQLTIAFITFQMIISVAFGQNKFVQSPTAIQYGYALKANGTLGGRPFVQWRIGLSGGVGGYMGNNLLYPTLHTDLMLYNGGLGSSQPGDRSNTLNIEVNVAYTLTGGYQNRLTPHNYANPMRRRYPLYYFQTFNAAPLQNPYNYSLSLGGNQIFFLKGKNEKRQAVGFIGLHIDRVQICYANDGPPFKKPIGDEYDRYYTGIGFVTFHGNTNWLVDKFEVGYDKFTGYSKNAYEMSNLLGLGYNYYKKKQQAFNKSHWYLNASSFAKRFEITMHSFNASKPDIQHTIHLVTIAPLHIVPYKQFYVGGGSFIYNQTTIGLQ